MNVSCAIEMDDLRGLSLKQAYHKPEDDIAHAFYLPCLACSTSYDRAVGYFSSAIYALAWPSLRRFVDRGGHIRMVCSPVLSGTDADALSEGYSARRVAEQGVLLKEEFQRLITTPGLVKPARVLASLVAIGVIDFRIAWLGDVAGGHPKRLFHDKLGIFRDSAGNAIAFKGSMNETWPGLALDGNLESVDVYLNWMDGRERERVEAEQVYFERLWNDDFPGVATVALPDVVRDSLVAAADPEHWRELVEDICIEIERASQWSPEARRGLIPRPHQLAALEAWRERDRRGILEHATGSGKTFTALCAIKDAFERGEIPLVLVPSDLLLQQWVGEIRSHFAGADLRLLICGGGHTDWRDQGRLRAWTRPGIGTAARAVVATIQTATGSEFLPWCVAGRHLFMVADEVHRLGAPQARALLELDTGPRLGLSATPERAGDPVGTAAIMAYFQGVVPPPFTLFDAIQAGALTPYAYHVHRISLDDDEQAQWDRLTREISKLAAQSKQAEVPNIEAEPRLKLLLIRRARIIKGAKQKIQAAVDVVKSAYRGRQHWIVYCDDQIQLNGVRDALRTAGCGEVLEYHTGMSGDPRQTLALFESTGGVCVSIRCLDEGIDIPAVSHALILASSKNPREYIQRRGRVLRRYPAKYVSEIHDVLVTPLFRPNESPTTSILEGELARAIEFGIHAINPGCITDLERLAIEHGIDWRGLTTAGLEDDDLDQVTYDERHS